ncbi:DNA-binding transcriptional regulator, AcrR family [Nonomuraea solani]|uniref:DNA-binding transcriptional regulator, AcrR family n=1 Tax=Nonomuraea solani TaxID=1144553 RepID=A0A1H6DKM7_9ACTN|nr:TetR/AcrR family transcriptional regulator [Nonomuraea solani]SEG85900.1 DNA-binding transcriptional regulator, AcrR family [Nonomuraea solani]
MDRRTRRRAETQDEILAIALDVMAEEGVAGLSLATVARRLGVRPPSLYKYFPSRHAVYDALFKRGQEGYLAAVRAPGGVGLRGMGASLEAGARWIMDNQVLAQLLFWRPVPGFSPSPESYAPALAIHEHFAALIGQAIERGELHPDAAGNEGLALAASLIAGVISQQLANQPGVTYEEGAFTRLVPRLAGMFAAAYPPP